MNGVVNTVTAETATTIGYKKVLVAFRVTPKVAMIKENSPICDKLIPVLIESFKGCPDNNAPNVELMDCPKMVTTDRIMTGIAC